jgi:hypothetical protein
VCGFLGHAGLRALTGSPVLARLAWPGSAVSGVRYYFPEMVKLGYIGTEADLLGKQVEKWGLRISGAPSIVALTLFGVVIFLPIIRSHMR